MDYGLRCVVALSWWCYLTDSSGGQVCLLQASMPTASFLLALQALFSSMISSPACFPPESQDRSPSKLRGVALFNVAITPSIGLPCGVVAHSRSRSWQRLGFATALVQRRFDHACAQPRVPLALVRAPLRRRLGHALTLAAPFEAISFAVGWHPLGRHFMSALGLVISPGLHCLGSCGGGSFSPTCRLDAGGSLGWGWCSAHNQQRSPLYT